MSLTEFLLARFAEDERGATDFEFGVLTRDGYLPKTITPARVLAECEAKRRIVEVHTHAARYDDGMWGEGARATLHLLALPYADHPDYREEWKP